MRNAKIIATPICNSLTPTPQAIKIVCSAIQSDSDQLDVRLALASVHQHDNWVLSAQDPPKVIYRFEHSPKSLFKIPIRPDHVHRV